MNKFCIYIFNLVLRCHHDQILERAAGLTYRVLLAFFPFLIFIMSLLGTLEVDESAILEGLFFVLPGDIADLVYGFLYELDKAGSVGVMSTALIFSVFNTSNGFRAIVRITNRAYGISDRRGFVTQVGLSFMLMLLFSAALIVMLALLVFRRQIWGIFLPAGHEFLFILAGVSGSLVILVFVTMVIYRLACATALPIKHILPGAVFTVITWLVISGGFGFVISNFTQYPAIYGSIAGVFILILWLNIISVILLIGNEANALIREFYPFA
ncbi:MAG: YihY/virulence factor BrkB family protein [Firmicutes bacterium]|nr:YihY/virulence factor BrkB family protein [Bacillota bacterium]